MGCGGSRADAIEPRYYESWTRETESTWLTNTDSESPPQEGGSAEAGGREQGGPRPAFVKLQRKDFYWAGGQGKSQLTRAALQASEKEGDSKHCRGTANSFKHISCWNDRLGFGSNGAAAWVFSPHPLRENSCMYFTNKPDRMR
ncbi:brain and acute leukemia cytoplasmic protein isoform X2 [Balearica regulorum gibbericeps]|uniref:brain and acute leukemia cytoplasmic protein isoform X2 n=1 Tax=Balearica regulorum gibbericeps TaxID=100784 RepID=UPI003F62BBF3